STKLNFPL
ncbi:hypothetical protein CP8484711_0058, partial [Chlamydia psittaci 84-8471/1]